MKRYTSIIIALVLALFIFLGKHYYKEENTDFSQYDWEQIMERGHITVAFALSEDGIMVSDTNTKSGFAYEKAKAFAEANNLKLNCVIEDNLSKQIDMLNSGKCDIIARDIPINKAMKESMLFTDPLSKDRMVLVQRAKDKNDDANYVYNQLDLIGKRIALPQNSPYITRINNLSKEIGDSIHIDIIENHDRELLIKLVSKGDIDFTVADLRTAKRMTKDYTNLDIHLPVGFTTLQAWAVRKSSSKLCEELNKYFKELGDK